MTCRTKSSFILVYRINLVKMFLLKKISIGLSLSPLLRPKMGQILRSLCERVNTGSMEIENLFGQAPSIYATNALIIDEVKEYAFSIIVCEGHFHRHRVWIIIHVHFRVSIVCYWIWKYFMYNILSNVSSKTDEKKYPFFTAILV